MNFVLIHVVLFAVWIVLLEKYPWPILALMVSLEAIFLSTFVMIGQNRQAAFQQAKADHDYQAQELELKTNTDLTRQIHVLTDELHRRLIDGSA
jgi:uncharacterized membrane protein